MFESAASQIGQISFWEKLKRRRSAGTPHAKVTPIVKTKYLLSYSYTFILETIRSLLKYTSAGGGYPRDE
jgi:hypothetical protein